MKNLKLRENNLSQTIQLEDTKQRSSLWACETYLLPTRYHVSLHHEAIFSDPTEYTVSACSKGLLLTEGLILPPRNSWTRSRECLAVSTASQWVGQERTEHPAVHRTASTPKHDPAQNMSSAALENHGSKESFFNHA